MSSAAKADAVRIGLECCVDDQPSALEGRRFGLLMNQASVDGRFCYSCDVLARRFPNQLAAIFSPQHGLWCQQQANMIETPHGFYQPLGVPVYSLYSETRRPTPDMLDGLDCLVVDLQDVGTRVYTFAWTVSYCLEACAEANIPAVILDRPNPLGGQIVEGPLLDAACCSFVGRAAIPMRHGLTMGELALLINRELNIGASVEVVPMQGWRRTMLFPETGRHWISPSPNMPRFETALLYPGQVLVEGTNLSEGRGTALPFEQVGAPFIDPHTLVDSLEPFDLPGVRLVPIRFLPTFDKWTGTSCGGVALHVVERQEVRSYWLGMAIIACIHELWPDEFSWLPPPYEYEQEKMPIDIISGSPHLRRRIDSLKPPTRSDVDRLAQVDVASWKRTIWEVLLYD